MKRREISPETYEQAEQFLEWNVSDRVFHTFIEPHWNADGSTFWFRKASPEETSFWFVNPFLREIVHAFDHDRLAKAIAKQWRIEIDPAWLPFDSFHYSSDFQSIFFFQDLILWRCDLDSYDCYAVDSSHIPPPTVIRSPDGKWDLCSREGNLYFVSTEEGEFWKWTDDARDDYGYGVSPDTNLSAVTRRRASYAPPPLALWSPDGKKVLSHRLDQRSVAALPLIQHCPEDSSLHPKLFTYRYPFVGEKVATQELLLFDIEKKACTLLQTDPLLVHLFSLIEMGWVWWSRNSNQIYFIREERGAKKLSLCTAHAETGFVETILTEESDEYVELSSLVPWTCYAKVLERTGRILWLSERDGWSHLYLYQEETGILLQQITSGPWNVSKVLEVDEQEEWVYFMACGRESHRDPYYPHLYRIRLDGTELKLLTPANAAHHVRISPSKKIVVDNYSTLNMDIVPSTEVFDTNGSKLLEFEQANLDQLFALGWRPPERFTAKASNGKTPVYGALYYPSHFDSEKRYPVIDFFFTGPQLIATPKGFSVDSHASPENWPGPWLAQALAELGFIVMNVDGMGTPLRSREFHHASYGHLEDACGLADHVHALKQLASERPYIDLDRVGILGHGTGGHAAVRALILFPDFYRVAISSSGDHDLLCYLAYWGEKYQGFYESARYRDASNCFEVDRIRGKLLLIHGELDENVHPCGTFRLVQALIQANKDFDLLIVPNENHWSYENPYVIRRIWDYFVEHLMGAVPPKEYLLLRKQEETQKKFLLMRKS